MEQFNADVTAPDSGQAATPEVGEPATSEAPSYEYVDLDGFGDKYVKVKIDGEELDVPLSEAVATSVKRIIPARHRSWHPSEKTYSVPLLLLTHLNVTRWEHWMCWAGIMERTSRSPTSRCLSRSQSSLTHWNVRCGS